jgi:hypothetical protein
MSCSRAKRSDSESLIATGARSTKLATNPKAELDRHNSVEHISRRLATCGSVCMCVCLHACVRACASVDACAQCLCLCQRVCVGVVCVCVCDRPCKLGTMCLLPALRLQGHSDIWTHHRGHTRATQGPHKGHTRATQGPLVKTKVFATFHV